MKEKGLRGSNRHCVHGLCKSDSRYPEVSPSNMFFIPFPKCGVLKDGMEEWKIKEMNLKTEKCKKWVHACGRPNFTIKGVTRNTYICSLHFIGENGPTLDHPDPIKATLSNDDIETLNRRARKRSRMKSTSTPVKHKNTKEVTSITEPADDVDVDDVDDYVLPEDDSGQNDDTLRYEDEDHLLVKSQETQTQYDKYMVGALVETMIMRNDVGLGKDNSSDSSRKNYGQYDFKIIVSAEHCKYFTGVTVDQFHALYDFLGDSKMNMHYWGGKGGGNELKQ